MIRRLSRAYASRWGAPEVDRVDTGIFRERYFMRCMDCSYCFDSCCAYGVDVDAANVARLDAHREGLEAFTGIPRARWFTGMWNDDPEFPGGRHTRTRVEDGACVFRNRAGRTPQGGPAASSTVGRTPQGGPAASSTVGRGCLIHSYALSRGVDYHELNPMVSVLFPVTFDAGLLHSSKEIEDRSLQCYGDGPTVYRGVRGEIGWYFGPDLVSELDDLESEALVAEWTSG
jgi:hypothetical protein